MSNLITRGLSRSNRQTLVVWGLLGAVRVVGAGPYGVGAYKEYLKQGTVWFRSNYKIKGEKAFKFKKKIKVLGYLKCDLLEHFILCGSKELGYLAEKYVSGNKQYNLNETAELVGSKEYNVNEKLGVIEGSRELVLNESIKVTGKKDIMSVLEAIDLL
jgi:hypothetical protein